MYGWLFRRGGVARCLACGYRREVSVQEWRRLPLPDGGDAYETWKDKQHVMGRSPMSAGQAVFVISGLVGAFVIIFGLFDIDDVENYEILFYPIAPVVMYGIWSAGRWLFPHKKIGNECCANCGHDLAGNEACACPPCGAGT